MGNAKCSPEKIRSTDSVSKIYAKMKNLSKYQTNAFWRTVLFKVFFLQNPSVHTLTASCEQIELQSNESDRNNTALVSTILHDLQMEIFV